MKKEMKTYLLRAIGMIILCWFFSPFFIPFTYPPRQTVTSEYVFVSLVGLSCAFVAYSKMPWRYALYYAFFAGIPEVFCVIGMYATNFNLQCMIDREPSATVILYPLGRMLLFLGVTAAAASFAATHIKGRLTCEPSDRTTHPRRVRRPVSRDVRTGEDE